MPTSWRERFSASATDSVSMKVSGELKRPPYEKSSVGAALYACQKALESLASSCSTPSAAVARMAISPRGIPRSLTALASTARAPHTHYEQLYISSIESSRAAAAPPLPDAAITPAPGEFSDRDVPWKMAAGKFQGSFLAFPKGHRLLPHQTDLIENYRPDAAISIAASA